MRTEFILALLLAGGGSVAAQAPAGQHGESMKSVVRKNLAPISNETPPSRNCRSKRSSRKRKSI